jgi:hypothetical protein
MHRPGVAYPRGFGALLVVETHVPADLMMTVVADGNGDGDGDYEYHQYTYSPGAVTEFSWALDHLDPGRTYYDMVAATDERWLIIGGADVWAIEPDTLGALVHYGLERHVDLMLPGSAGVTLAARP